MALFWEYVEMRSAFSMVAALAFTSSASAVTLYQVDEFDLSVAGWSEGGSTPNGPSTADTGLSGGAYLTNASTGTGGPGNRQLMWNDAQWSGDYIGEGITGISFDAANTGADAFNFRFAFNGAGGWFISDSVVLNDLSSGDLTAYALSITETDLTYVSGGTGTFADTMSGVTRLEIVSLAGISPSIGGGGSVLRGDSVATNLLLDNVRAIPEPGAVALSALALFGFAARRRRP
jgi:hypothetical protein